MPYALCPVSYVLCLLHPPPAPPTPPPATTTHHHHSQSGAPLVAMLVAAVAVSDANSDEYAVQPWRPLSTPLASAVTLHGVPTPGQGVKGVLAPPPSSGSFVIPVSAMLSVHPVAWSAPEGHYRVGQMTVRFVTVGGRPSNTLTHTLLSLSFTVMTPPLNVA